MADTNPDPVDIHVGKAVRERRKELGISQQQLAETIGLTFQQVQKYERGSNRISASKLYQIAQCLRVGAEFFFDGINGLEEGESEQSLSERHAQSFLTTAEGLELAKWFRQVAPRHRKGVLALVRSLEEVGEKHS